MVRALYFCMEDTWDEIGKQFDISPAQQHILFLLSTNGNALTPTKIGELGCWHTSTVSRLLHRLQKKGYIEVNSDKKSRFKKVSMTNEGKILLGQLLDAAKAMEQFPIDMQLLSENEILTFLECGQCILVVHNGKDFRKNVISKRVDNYDYA